MPFSHLPLLHSPGYRQLSPSNKSSILGSEDGQADGDVENEGESDGLRVVRLLVGSNDILGLIDGFCDKLGATLGSSDMDGLTVGKKVGTAPQSASDTHGMQASVASSRIFFALLTDGR